MQCGQRPRRILLHSVTLAFRVEIDLPERQTRFKPELLRMLLQIVLQLRVVRFGLRSQIVGDEFHLLPQPAADHGVIAIQPQGYSFACEDFLTNVFLNHSQPMKAVKRPGSFASSAASMVCPQAER